MGSLPSGIFAGHRGGGGLQWRWKLDLAVANSALYGDTVSILLANGDGTFRPAVVYTVPPNYNQLLAMVVADFNGDGKLDLAFATNSSSVAVLLGNGDGTFQTVISTNSQGYTVGLAVATSTGTGYRT
jgi:hypothetical protein